MRKGKVQMADKFDPAPHDKHADGPNDREANRNAALHAGLVGSFPASDPVSIVQPSIAGRGDGDMSLWRRIMSFFR